MVSSLYINSHSTGTQVPSLKKAEISLFCCCDFYPTDIPELDIEITEKQGRQTIESGFAHSCAPSRLRDTSVISHWNRCLDNGLNHML